MNHRLTVQSGCFFLISLFILFHFSSCKNERSSISLPESDEEEIVGNVRIWPSIDTLFAFPEEPLAYKKTGVCFSGGGTRAMVCAVGQMKGLYDLDLFDDIGYISCASGGSWASVPFTYYSAGAANDEQLLGTVIPPGSLTIDGMASLDPGFLAGAANADLIATILENIDSVDVDDLWIKGVSESYMQPFGVYNEEKKMYFSLNDSTVANICSRNPSLSADDFITVHDAPGDAKRPYLIVNSCIVGPYDNAPYKDPEQLAVFNYTPLYVGSANAVDAEYTPDNSSISQILRIGGGFIEPFAFGADAPVALPQQCKQTHLAQCIQVDLPNDTFSMADASGTSSSAFAADLSHDGFDGISLSSLLPEVNYFTIDTDSLVQAQTFMFGDGGNLENFGLISLLQRKVKDIIVFANSAVAINTAFDTSTVATPKDVDSDFLPLFGIEFSPTSDQNQNQVFKKKDFPAIMQQLIETRKSGQTVIAKSQLITVDNPWWGITAGDTININWFYNEKVDTWQDSLALDIKLDIDLGPLGQFKHFPLYKLVLEDGRLVRLSAEQINLLYQLSAWNVYTNQDAFDILTDD